MSSPWRGADTTSPSARVMRDDSRYRRKGQQSPYRQTPDALSSSVWDEFSRLYVNEDRTFRHQLDEQVAEQERLHREALALAAAEHERVREGAERARERVELEIDRERKRREEEDIKALEAERTAAAARDAAEIQRLRDELERQETEQVKRAAEQKDIEARRARLAERERQAEADAVRQKAELEETERRAKQESTAAAAATAAAADATKTAASVVTAAPSAGPAQAESTSTLAHPTQPTTSSIADSAAQARSLSAVSPTVPSSATSSLATSSKAARESQHQRYLDLHQGLKAMRKYVLVEGKKNPALKTKLGEWRRTLKVLVGQLTADKENNKKPLREISTLLGTAQQHLQPSVDVSSYVISYPTDGSPMVMSGPLVYLLNMLSKNIITQLISEAAVIAEPLGILTSSIFAAKNFKANGTFSLIDILLAKFHACCPVLWGIYGSEKTEQGRARIGWWKVDGKNTGDWEPEQRHVERMTGLGRGYAAISLRDFSKSKNENPFPPSNYWKTISYIVNTPPSEAQPTHFYVLKALLQDYIPRFVSFYGMAALVALRKALIEFPAQAPNGPARNAVMIMPQQIQKELRLTL